MNRTALTYLLPALVAIGGIAFWEWAVTAFEVSKFVLPAPSSIASAFLLDAGTLSASTWVTLRITVLAFVLALLLGVSLAILFSQSRLLERALFPYAVTLQVTPVVAIAPLILIWVGLDNAERAVLILATIVAFFPILSNTTLGLRSADPQLHELFDLYGASRWQRLWRLHEGVGGPCPDRGRRGRIRGRVRNIDGPRLADRGGRQSARGREGLCRAPDHGRHRHRHFLDPEPARVVPAPEMA
jgi:ABC-type nitrate/sulfonate/bicarbonate transport system permease component